jgi:predicted Zn-dependent protease
MNIRHFAALFLAALLAGCAPVKTTQSGAIGVERQQYMMVSAQEAESMALTAYGDILQKARTQGKLNTDSRQLERLRKIGLRIVPHVGVFREDAMRWKWELNLITSNEINAFCAAGGKVVFYTGIIDRLELTDDEIAAVMGHEIAHALREHSREKMSQIYGQQLAILGVALATKMDEKKAAALQTVGTLALTLPHSRGMESESDRIGLELMARAGYNPRAAVTLWQKMAVQQGGASLEFLSTHPSDKTRINDIHNHLPRVMPLYEKARVTGPR